MSFPSSANGTLRHGFATHLLEGGVALFTIQKLLGHGHKTTVAPFVDRHTHRVVGNCESQLELKLYMTERAKLAAA